MYVKKKFSFRDYIRFSFWHIIGITAWVLTVTLVYHYTKWEWMTLPFLPISIIATAVAFYVGFKNNSSYDRMWEARKIWGGIVNVSRSYASTLKAFSTTDFTGDKVTQTEVNERVKKSIYRHIAWLYALRGQLLIPENWEHNKNNNSIFGQGQADVLRSLVNTEKYNKRRIKRDIKSFLDPEELNRLIKNKNTATQLIDQQSQDLSVMRTKGILNDFRQMELQKLLVEMYNLQGKAERIKKFPFPRQYGDISIVFVGIFIFLLPFGLVQTFEEMGHFGIWLGIPFTILISWIYVMMDLVGDYSENPFESLPNDIPMLNMCRTIEIDLREVLGETDLPRPIKPINGILP